MDKTYLSKRQPVKT